LSWTRAKNSAVKRSFRFTTHSMCGSFCRYEGWLAGYQFAFDTSKSALTKNNIAAGYNGSDVQCLATV